MNQLDTPVLFIIFNRFDTSIRVFEQIKKAQPKQLFIAADGPRNNIIHEKEKCNLLRNYILKNIDWKCEVKTLFRNKNLGVGKAVSEAINWLFQYADQGIILEDDYLPSMSFFQFCQEMLLKYQYEPKIYAINGFNSCSTQTRKYWDDYGFRKIPHIWGWATWKRVWNQYDFHMKNFNQQKINLQLSKIFLNQNHKKYWGKIFLDTYLKKIDTWDYQFAYLIFKNNAFCVAPNRNLINNIGFGIHSTNTLEIGHPLSKTKNHEIDFPIHTNALIETNQAIESYDMKYYFMRYYKIKNILKKLKIFNFIKYIYKKFFIKL